METTLNLILQLVILLCQIAVGAVTVLVVLRNPAAHAPLKRTEEKQPEVSEEERRMQEQMQKMMDGMQNILGYNGMPQGDRR